MRLEIITGQDEEPGPHPEWAASIRPTPEQMIAAASVLGWLPPEGGYLTPLAVDYR